MRSIRLNADIAEGFPWDDELMGIVQEVNICCGAHAGSPEQAVETASRAAALGLRVTAHPSYPDPANFGRKSQTDWSPHIQESLKESIVGQVGLILNWATAIKPHGALYNDAFYDLRAAALCGLAALEHQLPLVSIPHANMRTAADLAAVPLIPEGFADRAYAENGFLLPRSMPGAMLADDNLVASQVLALSESVETICIHGDNPDCLRIARFARQVLTDHGWVLAP